MSNTGRQKVGGQKEDIQMKACAFGDQTELSEL